MIARFEVDLTKDDYVGGLSTLMGELARADPYRERHIWEQVGAFALLFIVLAFAFSESAIAVIVTVAVMTLVHNGLAARWTRKATGASYDPATARFTVEFGEGGILERNPHRERNWQWGAVRQVHDNGTMLVFELDGWDMLILPDRMWSGAQERNAFLQQARQHVPARSQSPQLATVTQPDRSAPEILLVGAIAAGIDVMFVATTFVPSADGPGGTATTVIGLLIGAALGYLAYRLARVLLPQLHAGSPRAAVWLSNLLAAALPIYIAAAYFGWF